MPTAGPAGEVRQRPVGDNQIGRLAGEHLLRRAWPRPRASRSASPWIGSSGRRPRDRPRRETHRVAPERDLDRARCCIPPPITSSRPTRTSAISAGRVDERARRQPTSPRARAPPIVAVFGEKPRVDSPDPVDERAARQRLPRPARHRRPGAFDLDVQGKAGRIAQIGLKLDRAAVLGIPGIDTQSQRRASSHASG